MIMNEMNMFGCEKSDLDAAYAEMVHAIELKMCIMGMMSDAQHEMAHGMNETARKTLNRAKYFVSKMLEDSINAERA
jgi:hypothetical protein